MSYEDVIRVAQAKIDPARLERIVREMDVKAGQTFAITEFLKPGVEEFCSILPSFLARGVLGLAERFPGWRGLIGHGDQYAFDFRLSAVRASGEAAPASPRNLPLSARTGGDRCLARVSRAGGAAFGRACDRSRRMSGPHQRLWRYAKTRRRQLSHHRRTCIAPALAGAVPLRQAIDAVASARTAALLDAEGEALAKCLAGLASVHAIAAE